MYPHLTTLMSQLPSDHIITITGATLALRNGDVYYPFRQDSDFLYLTGLSVPGLVLTIWKQSEQNPPSPLSQGGSETTETILWREPITDLDRVWGSDKLTDEEMVRIAGIVDIRDIGGLEEYSKKKTEQNPPSPLRHNSLLEVQTQNLYQGGTESLNPETLKSIIHSLRLIKTPDEIEKIRKAIVVSQEAFAHIESILRPRMYEYEIDAEIARIFRSHHLTEAYPSIVASGANACVLHYTAHTRQLESGDLVLIDAGAEHMGYASDMTRTLVVG